MEEKQQQEIDLNKVYEYAKFPDKVSGRCNNCNSSYFKSSVKGGVFLRKCRNVARRRVSKYRGLYSKRRRVFTLFLFI
ncbi:hypothetical protein BUW91_27320 (plasmid) [Priestia megaterium]|nr:hypothetical protein BUW91_27320 [Priestia megaterium]